MADETAQERKEREEREAKAEARVQARHEKVAGGIDRGIQVLKVATARLDERADEVNVHGVEQALDLLRQVRDQLRGEGGDESGEGEGGNTAP